MNIALRYPELGKEIRITLSSENYLEEISYQLISSFGLGSDSFILLNEEGISIKDKNAKPLSITFVYAFLKDSIKKDKQDPKFEFSLQTSHPEPPVVGEERGVLILEKSLYKLYIKSLSNLDFIKSYIAFTVQLEKEMEIILNSTRVLELYHNKHIKDQSEAFNTLTKKNTLHCEEAEQELLKFEQAVIALGSFKIHSKLRTELRENLSQLIDISQLSRWKESYIAEIQRLQIKFKDLQVVINELPFKYQLPGIPQTFIHKLEVTPELLMSANFPAELYLEYRSLCEKFINDGDAVAGARLHEEQWEKKITKAKQLIGYFESNQESYQKSIQDILNQRKTANLLLFNLLRKITEFAARIRDTVKSQLSMLASLLKRSEKRLAFIRVPKLLPEAHDSTVVEISRRNHFVKAASELKDQLNTLIEIEISERMEFLEKYRHVLPNNFVPQLSAAPFIKIVVSPDEPDLTLPEIFDSLPYEFEHRNKYLPNQSQLVHDLKERISALEHTILAHTQETNAYKQEIIALNTKIASAEALNKQISDQNTDKERQIQFNISELKRQYEDSNKQLISELNALKRSNESYIQEKNNYSETQNCLVQQNQELKEIVKNFELKLKSTQENYSQHKLEESLKNAQSLIKASSEREILLKKENEKIMETLKKMQNELKNKDRVISDAAKQLESFSDEFKKKETSLNEIKARLASEKTINDELQKQLSKGPNKELISLCEELQISPTVGDISSYINYLKETNMSKISFTDFTTGSLALFFPTSERHFLAFNYNCPDHYLNIDSISEEDLNSILSQPYIVGLITEKKTVIADKTNPLLLPPGSTFYLLSIKQVHSNQ
jgi:Autophagy-related protein 11